jgi:glycosyltransferase involved in cell wall biosynthesis
MELSSFPLVAVVMPVFNESAVLPETIARLTAVFNGNATVRWEVVMVDDGSRDRSREIIRTAGLADPRFKLVELSRNFGFQAALAAGIASTTADAVVTMDADLQDPPECIPAMVTKWQAGAKIVLATRRSRMERGVRRVGFDLFHRWFNRVIDSPLDANVGTFGLMDRIAVDALKALPERHRFFPGLRSWVGFQKDELLYDREERAAGQPQQTFRKLVRYALDGVFSFSYLPLRLLTYIGSFVSLFGFALGGFFVMRRLMGIEVAQTGFTTLVTLVLFLGGIQILGIGVLGEYLARVYDEVKQRPLYLIKPRTGSGCGSGS